MTSEFSAGANFSPAGGKTILPSQHIEKLIESGEISMDTSPIEGQIQPASLDLRLGGRAYRVRASFLPGPQHKVRDRLENLTLHEIDLAHGAVLERDCVYVVELQESLRLPEELSAIANPKSSTGRLDVFTRVISDHSSEFDQIASGYQGPLFAEICPQTFPVLLREGSRLSQIRFRIPAPPGHIPSGEAVPNSPLALRVDLSGDPEGGLIGYRARRHTGVVDVDLPGGHAIADYWEPLPHSPDNRLILDPDAFYILASRENVRVPAGYAAEMAPFNPVVGEFRVHYAGFFDPGFGDGPAGAAKAVLEVRSHKVPFILDHNQVVGHLLYEPLLEAPEKLYGQGIGSHYQAQGLKLSKHFR